MACADLPQPALQVTTHGSHRSMLLWGSFDAPRPSVQMHPSRSAEGSPKEHSNGAHWNEKKKIKNNKKTLGDRTERHLAFDALLLRA